MKFESPLTAAILLRRYKRFLADVRLPGGRQLTVHCPNTGAMLGCDRPGMPVWISRSDNPKRKYAHTLELVEALPGTLVGVNTARSNRLVAEAIGSGAIPELRGYDSVRREVPVGASRIDFALEGEGRRRCLVEVKNVTAAVSDGVALFPDAVSVRAARHVRELAGCLPIDRSVLLFCVQRSDVTTVEPAHSIDPEYAGALRAAEAAGVEIMAWGCDVSPEAVCIQRRLAFRHGDLAG